VTDNWSRYETTAHRKLGSTRLRRFGTHAWTFGALLTERLCVAAATPACNGRPYVLAGRSRHRASTTLVSSTVIRSTCVAAWAGSLARCWSSACDVACHKAGSVMEGHLDNIALSKSMTAL
jgi:hypothetical protein